MRGQLLPLAAALVISSSATAHAFCGFYVKQDDDEITSDASRVILLREGTTTVLSMQNRYEGPPEDFALIVPVPTAIGEDDVRVLEPEVFDTVDQLSSPRLVEYQERAPVCLAPGEGGGIGSAGFGLGGGSGGAVSVVAQFAVGEYDVEILDASESTGLEAWLRAQGYRVPDGASAALAPYIAQGFRFFAARVNADRVRFEDGRALLSPLRIHYESEHFVLPVRLGRLSSPGEQELLIYVISNEGRYEVANRRNVFVPTNLEVSEDVRGRFGATYAALLDRVFERREDAVVTEYAWDAGSCDPCPGPTLGAQELTDLGGDHLPSSVQQSGGAALAWGPFTRTSGPPVPEATVRGALSDATSPLVACVTQPTTIHVELALQGQRAVGLTSSDAAPSLTSCLRAVLGVPDAAPDGPVSRVATRLVLHRTLTRFAPSASGFTLTRMRYRMGPNAATSDLVFRRARPVEGGRGEPDERGHFRTEPHYGQTNAFQARYAILHRVEPAPCEGRLLHAGWGAPASEPESAQALVDGPSSGQLRDLVRTPVPAYGLRPRRRRASSGAMSLWSIPWVRGLGR